jgi:hypothetical protein
VKYPVLAVALVVIMVNASAYSYWTAKEEGADWTQHGPGGGSDIVPIANITVKVPPKRAGDVLQYDYSFFAEAYDHNLTSGNWSRTWLIANGQRLDSYPGVSTQRDGFDQPHQVYQSHTTLRLSAVIGFTSYSPGQDSQPLIISGRVDGDRDKYSTLRGDIPIESYSSGTLSVDEIKGWPGVGVNNLKFDVSTTSWPDPNIAPEVPLDEQIYANGATLEQGKNGTYSEHQASWGNISQVYNWSVEGSDSVRGYNCSRLNISSDFFGVIFFRKVIWLSNEVPLPVRIVYNSTTFWADANEEGHIIINSTQTLQKNGYIKGGAVIDVQPGAKESFVKRHPSADIRDWTMGPEDGPLDGSSFDFGLQEALDYAITASPALDAWLEVHPKAMVADAYYGQNSTNQGLNVEEYIWNITLADDPGDWEDAASWYPTNAYTLNITKTIERHPVLGDRVTYAIDSETGPRRGAPAMRRADLSKQLVTLASSEDIWALVPEVAAKAYKGITQKVDFKDAVYEFSLGGASPSGFGMDLLDTLTGVSVPTSNTSWAMQVGNVWEGTSTYMVALDAETGRMVFISDITAPQALMLIFGGASGG